MKMSKLEPYQKLYNCANAMGAAKILREYLGEDIKFPIPLSLSHGVDMGQTPLPMEVDQCEPIHWSCNITVHNLALKYKPSILVPHPWLLLKARVSSPLKSNALIVGPPPGASNDRGLLNNLRANGIMTGDILLKSRGDIEPSRNFWMKSGFNTITAGEKDDLFYTRLHQIICEYDTFISGTASSALIFAASLGKTCLFLKDYTYSAYEVKDYLKKMNFQSETAKKFVNLVVDGEKAKYVEFSRYILGDSCAYSPASIKRDLIGAVEALKYPCNIGFDAGDIERKVLQAISRLTGKSGLLKSGVAQYLKKFISSEVEMVNMNEVDIWLNGLSSSNFSSELVPYIKGVTEPGWAVD